MELLIVLVIWVLLLLIPVALKRRRESKKKPICTCGGFLIHDERTERIYNPADYCPIHKKK